MKVKFVPDNVEFEIGPEQTILELAQEKGVKIKSVCNGLPSCAECRVRLVEGETNVLPPSASELILIGTGYFIDQRRLSCQLRCFGDVVVDLSEQKEKVHHDEQKRPQGSLRKDDSEKSYAVMGNLIDQESDLLNNVEEEIQEKTAQRQNKQPSSKKPNHRRNNRHRGNRGRRGGHDNKK